MRTFASTSVSFCALALLVPLALAACGTKAPAAAKTAPLEPPAHGGSVDAPAPKAELAKPPPPIVAESTPVAPPPIPPIPPADLDSMIQALGPLQVISPDEAKQKATQEITPQNADAELQKLKAELGGGG